MFFTYNQNNSGGSFDYDESAGISHYVIIEADNAEEADSIANNIGLYFDGVYEDRDCDCCGDRWYAQSTWYDNGMGDDVASVYGHEVEKLTDTELGMRWINGYEIFVHYADGKVKGFLP